VVLAVWEFADERHVFVSAPSWVSGCSAVALVAAVAAQSWVEGPLIGVGRNLPAAGKAARLRWRKRG